MWLILGVAAVAAAVLNIAWTAGNKDAKWFRFISVSLTAFTLCAEYSLVEKWVLKQDWSALMDVVPGMSKTLWILTAISILINGASLFLKYDP